MDKRSSAAVGFVGLGKMGSEMTARILASGRKVIGWDIRGDARDRLACAGGTAAAGIAGLQPAPLVISMVFDDATTREAVLAPGGLIDVMQPGAIHVSLASISPELARELSDAHAARGQKFLSGSVFGRPEAAQAGKLIINCSGARGVFDTVGPVLRTIGEPQFVGREPEQAILLKLMSNNMIFSAAELLAEAFAFLSAGGIAEGTAKSALIDRLFPGVIFDGYSRATWNAPLPPSKIRWRERTTASAWPRRTEWGWLCRLSAACDTLFWGRFLQLDLPGEGSDLGPDHFGSLAKFVCMDIRAASRITRERLRWNPEQSGLLQDMAEGDYFAPRAG